MTTHNSSISKRLGRETAVQALGNELLIENEYLRLQLRKTRDGTSKADSDRIKELELSHPHLKLIVAS